MTTEPIAITTNYLQGFVGKIEQPTKIRLVVETEEGTSHPITILPHNYEDILCLYSLVSTSNHSIKEIEHAIKMLIKPSELQDTGSYATYQRGCNRIPQLKLNEFLNKHHLPLKKIFVSRGSFKFRCQMGSYSGSLTPSNEPNMKFTALFTWFVLLMFGADTLRKYTREAHKLLSVKDVTIEQI